MLTACVRSHTTIEIHPADLVSFDIQVRATRSLVEQANLSSAALIESAKKRIPEPAQAVSTIEPIEEPDWVGARLTTLPIPANQANQFVRYERDGNKARVDVLYANIRPKEFGVDDQALKSAGAEMTISAVFPGRVLASNGVIRENTVTWDLLTMTEDPWVEAQVGPETWVIAAAIGIGALGIVMLVYGVVRLARAPRRVALN